MLKINIGSINDMEIIAENDGNSIVYRGDLEGDTVAIKELTDETEHLFDNEVEIMSLLDHPYVISLRAVIKDSALPSLVMDYMPNGTLTEYLRTKVGWGAEQKIDMARRIGRGLVYLHENNILHLDLKTANILIDEDEKPKICDFGFSVVLASRQETHTSNERKGTPRWFTPEALKSARYNCEMHIYSRETDVYTYALIVWSLYSQKKPYESISDHDDINTAIVCGRHENENELTEPHVQELCLRAWSLTPKKRPPIDKFVRELQKLTLT